MARKRPAPKYAGALAQPIYVDQDAPGYHRYPDVTETLKEMWQTRAAEKMLLLFKHYKIDPSDEQSWQKLAIQVGVRARPRTTTCVPTETRSQTDMEDGTRR